MLGWTDEEWKTYEQEENAYKAKMKKFFESENGRKCRYVNGGLHYIFCDKFNGIKPVLYKKVYNGLAKWINSLVVGKGEEERMMLKNSFEKCLVDICEDFERAMFISEELFLQKINRIMKDNDCKIEIDEDTFKTLEDAGFIKNIDDSIRDF